MIGLVDVNAIAASACGRKASAWHDAAASSSGGMGQLVCPAQRRTLGPSLWTILACIVALVMQTAPARASTFPAASEVVDRVLATPRETQATFSDVVLRLRIGTSATASPRCVFQGRLEVWPDHSRLTVVKRTPRLVCWAIQRFVLTRLLSDRDHAASLLPLFRFEVLGEKLVDGHPYYLLEGRALSPRTEPRWAIGWVDYDRGLVMDDTVQYGSIRVHTVQAYGRVGGLWVLIRQHIAVPRFRTSLDIAYHNIRVVPTSERGLLIGGMIFAERGQHETQAPS